MGSCKCAVLEKGIPGNWGGKLMWTWSDSGKSSTFVAYERWCNPMNCSNTACTKKGCAEARKKFCSTHGYHCPSLGRKVCWGDPCPGGAIKCSCSRAEAAFYGVPLCSGCIPGTGGAPPPSGGSPPSGSPPGNCASGNFMACLSEIGDSFGKFFTDASRSGSQQLPLLMLLGGGLLLVLLLRR